jgi:hypothetical protein
MSHVEDQAGLVLLFATQTNIEEAEACLFKYLALVGYPALKLPKDGTVEDRVALINCVAALCRAREEGKTASARADTLVTLLSQRESTLETAEASLRHATMGEHSRTVWA